MPPEGYKTQEHLRIEREMQDAKTAAEKCAEYIAHYTELKRQAHQTYYRAKLELKQLTEPKPQSHV